MADDLKNAAAAVFGLALVSGFALHRAEHAIVKDFRKTAVGGTVKAWIEPKGLFGALTGQAKWAKITATNFASDGPALAVTPHSGGSGKVDLLILDLSNATLRGTAVAHYTSEIPNVRFDALRVMWDETVFLRSAEEGTASATVTEQALRAFLERKYSQFKDVKVQLSKDSSQVSARSEVPGAKGLVVATGQFLIVDGRLLNVTEPQVTLNGRKLSPSFAKLAVAGLNPVLDVHKDLGLAGYFRATGVKIGQGVAELQGVASIPSKIQKTVAPKQ